MQMIIYFLVALIPGVLWVGYIRAQDVHEPEPVWCVYSTFGWGLLAFIPVVIVESILGRVLLSSSDPPVLHGHPEDVLMAAVYCFIVIAPVEEYFKYRVVRKGIYNSEEFNEPMDGIVYMAAAGLGFATLENALYMVGFGANIILLRALLSTFLHIACSSIVGYYLGRARFDPEQEEALILRGLFIASLVHGAYDFMAIYMPGIGFVLILILLGYLRRDLRSRMDLALEDSPFRPDAEEASEEGTV